jgi:hypothetical protein
VIASVHVGGLSAEPLQAAAQFYAEALPRIAVRLEDQDTGLVIVFAPADYTHRGWRLAAVQQLARDHAPLRVNAVASDDDEAIAAALAYLGGADGVTGQYLPLDGNGAVGLLSRNQ